MLRFTSHLPIEDAENREHKAMGRIALHMNRISRLDAAPIKPSSDGQVGALPFHASIPADTSFDYARESLPPVPTPNYSFMQEMTTSLIC